MMAGNGELERKRAKVAGKTGASKGPGKGGRKPREFPATLVVLVCATIIVTGLIQFGPRILGTPESFGGAAASNGRIDMTDLTATVADGKIAVPVATVQEKRLVRFTYKGTNEIPLLAYVAPSGKLVTAVSMCEPCSSTRFFIKGNKIVCTTCGTEWDLESLRGIQGGCTTYPPDKVVNTVDAGVIRIDENSVANWKSRI